MTPWFGIWLTRRMTLVSLTETGKSVGGAVVWGRVGRKKIRNFGF